MAIRATSSQQPSSTLTGYYRELYDSNGFEYIFLIIQSPAIADRKLAESLKLPDLSREDANVNLIVTSGNDKTLCFWDRVSASLRLSPLKFPFEPA